MRRSFVPAALAIALPLLGSCSDVMRATFPTEEEVRGKLLRGMTAEQVLATFGEPPGHQWVDVKLGGKVHYIAPAAARTKQGEGYAGFTVYFDRGKVWDWEVILMNPSYEHRLVSSRRVRWTFALVGIVVLGAVGYSALRATRARRSDREALLKAYATRGIPTAELPPDFSFITHGTILQSVIDKAGPYSRIHQLRVNAGAAETTAPAFEYELPSGGAVFVMPEPPFQPDSRIRAVFHRRPPGGPQI